MKRYALFLSILNILSCQNKERGVGFIVPEIPKRIVADYYTGELIALKAPLVGANLTYKSSAWGKELDSITDIGDSLETIMSLDPDLIITIHSNLVEQYQSIAPTLLIPYGKFNPEELLQELGRITSKGNNAVDLIKEFNQNIQSLKNIIRNKDTTFTIIDIWGKAAYLYGEHFGRGGYIIYNKLALEGTIQGEKDYIRKSNSYMNLNIETLPKYCGDVLLVMRTNIGDGDYFITSEIWNNLTAVKNNKVIYLDSRDFQFQDPLSLNKQIGILKEVLSVHI